MARDDVNVIVYKILKYLYECKKLGYRPRVEDITWNANLLRIPELYWIDVILDLKDKGYIKGVNAIDTKDGTIITTTDRFGITLDGMQYVDDNSAMTKTKEYLGAAVMETIKATILK